MSVKRVAAGLFLIIAAVRIALVLAFAPENPYYDEWDSVIDLMARPMLAGNFSVSFLLTPHNEHTLVWTKLVSYLQLRWSDLQFDNVLVCEFNQVLYAAIAASLIALAASKLGSFRWWFVACSTLLIALPYGWETISTSWGNVYYFLIGFSVAAILLAATARGTVGASVAIVLCALAAGVSMGSGLFAAPVAILAVLLRLRIADFSATIATRVIAAILAAAILIAATTLRTHPSIGWGAVQSIELLLLVLLLIPTWCLLLRIWRRDADNVDIAFVCVALWGTMQIGAVLLARPEFRLWNPTSRYIDVLATAALANTGCLCRLALIDEARRFWKDIATATMAFAIVLVLAFAPFAWHWTNAHAADERVQTQRLIRYIRGNDTDAIVAAPANELPYPVRDRLLALIDAKDVRYLLGDRVGTRPTAAPLVEKARAFDATLIRNGIWLLPLLLIAGLLILVRPARKSSA